MKIEILKIKHYILSIIILLVSLLLLILFITNVRADEKEGIKVPIIMYHSVLNSERGKFIVSPEELENDLKYIKEKGYTTVTMTDLIEHVYNNMELPEKSIVLTFDDGYYNNYNYAVPLLIKYDMKAVISILGKSTDEFSNKNEVNINYGYIRWIDINMLVSEGTIEFQNHSYDLHSKGCKKRLGESYEEYKERLKNDIMKLQEEFKNNSYYTPNTFTYPLGIISKNSETVIKELGFKASLSCKEGINYITKEKESLYWLKRFNRAGGISTEKFFSKIGL